MRTATPLATCSVTSDAGPSATAAAISTPRFIGPGCITSASGLSSRGARRGEPVAGGVLAHRREQRLLLALELHAQQHHDVDLGDHRRRGRGSPRPASLRATRGSSVGGATSVTSAPSMCSALHVAPGDPRVPRRRRRWRPAGRRARPAVAAQGEHVEQRLGGVRVAAVAGVDDRRRRSSRDAVGRAGGRVADDDARRCPSRRWSAPCRAGSRPSSPTTAPR